MELVYLWVDKYKNIKEQGFNFSGKYRCDFKATQFDDNNIIENGNLNIEKHDSYVENLFGDNSLDIIALVGENGSGKSTIFEIFSLAIFEQKIELLKNTLLFFIHEDTQSLYCFNAYLTNKDSHTKIGPKILHIESSLEQKFSYIDKFTTNQIVSHFFSNWFTSDFTSEHHKFQNTYQFYQGVQANKYRYMASLSDEEKEDASFFEEKIDLKLIELLKKDNNYFYFIDQSNIYLFDIIDVNLFSISEFENNLDHKRFNLFEGYDLIHKVYYFPKLSLFVNEIMLDLVDELSQEEERFFIELLYNIRNEELIFTIEQIDEYQRDDRKKIEQQIEKNIYIFNNELKTIFLKFNNEKFQFIAKNYDLILNRFVDITSNQNLEWQVNIKQLNEIEMFILKIAHENHIKRISFKNSSSRATLKSLSSGEQSIILFLTNVFHALENNSNFKNKIYLFDEIEIRLHPNWQKKLLSLLLKGLLHHRKRNFKCIFATHSPFILSDLPKENTIFLKDGKNISSEIAIKTFGANIHTLLSHGFFMENGLMGEFAKEKIAAIKDFYEKVKVSEYPKKEYEQEFKDNIDNFRHIHSIIGEPFLKTIIKNYLDDLALIFYDNNTLIDEALGELEKRREYLESLKNAKN
jgi:predicted ATP-binding protein involved in virulence